MGGRRYLDSRNLSPKSNKFEYFVKWVGFYFLEWMTLKEIIQFSPSIFVFILVLTLNDIITIVISSSNAKLASAW